MGGFLINFLLSLSPYRSSDTEQFRCSCVLKYRAGKSVVPDEAVWRVCPCCISGRQKTRVCWLDRCFGDASLLPSQGCLVALYLNCHAILSFSAQSHEEDVIFYILFLCSSHSAHSLPWCLIKLVLLNQVFQGPHAARGMGRWTS